MLRGVNPASAVKTKMVICGDQRAARVLSPPSGSNAGEPRFGGSAAFRVLLVGAHWAQRLK